MSFPPKIKEDVLVATARCCSICHKFCGIKIELHHIKEQADGGLDTFENAIALCFDCHADMRSYDHKHPKGTKYTREELIAHRDAWYNKVKGSNSPAVSPSNVESDRKIYLILVKTLPWNGSIEFISTNNFAGFSFSLRAIDQLHDFEFICKDPSFEFMDPDLENLRATLHGQIAKFTMVLCTQTFPTNTSERNAVPEEWEYEQPERFREVVTTLHSTAKIICGTYVALTRTARRKLDILPPHMA